MTFASTPNSRRKELRVLAFGDSLTAGTSGFELYPYAPYLEEAMNNKRAAEGKSAPAVVVRHRGLPGWTASAMVQDLDGERTGLRSAIRAVKDPPLSVVILLAGTNDLGYGFAADEVTASILKLHKVCFEEGVPRTIAIGVPPSGYQSVNVEARALANAVTTNLEAFCSSNSDKTRFHPFPFPFEPNGKNWYADGLHFSQRGYQVLGESVAPVLEEVLHSLDDT